MIDVNESEIELRNKLAARFRQLGSDLLRLFKLRNVVAAKTSITADQAFADKQVFLIGRHGLNLFASFDIGRIVSQELESDIVEGCRVDLRQRLLFPLRVFQREQIR